MSIGAGCTGEERGGKEKETNLRRRPIQLGKHSSVVPPQYRPDLRVQVREGELLDRSSLAVVVAVGILLFLLILRIAHLTDPVSRRTIPLFQRHKCYSYTSPVEQESVERTPSVHFPPA